MAAKNNGDKPDTPDLNLDALEEEGSPYVFILGGKRYEVDPQQLDWQAVMDAMEAGNNGDLRRMFHLVLGDEDWSTFSDTKLPWPKFQKLATGLFTHLGNALGDQGEGSVSAGASVGT